ncbi:hypothetical protein HPB47_004100 [Ixodes persulcatus]|uniref:Uncharacterized protein n=1 Tax=Ixodes persulcatus TaxID=34615 RepID=A0AC60PGQ8_IXOPE|nr:hypothetical protein HPB47_004100 [Ixodes persulcatus]
MSDVATTHTIKAIFARCVLLRDRVFLGCFHPLDVFAEEGLHRRFQLGRDGIRCVADLLARYLHRPPRRAELHELHRQFYAVDGFPSVVRAIDGTHVWIFGPLLHEELVVNARSWILKAIVNSPGSVHDLYLLSQSSVGEDLLTGAYGGILIGDSGYPCRPRPMSPFQLPTAPAECAYNQTHATTRFFFTM